MKWLWWFQSKNSVRSASASNAATKSHTGAMMCIINHCLWGGRKENKGKLW